MGRAVNEAGTFANHVQGRKLKEGARSEEKFSFTSLADD